MDVDIPAGRVLVIVVGRQAPHHESRAQPSADDRSTKLPP
jgi:hypothetical protein